MRLLTIICLALLTLPACNKDQECPAEDYVGTYIGERTCLFGLTGIDTDTVIVTRVDDDELLVVFNENIKVELDDCTTTVSNNVVLGSGLEGNVNWEGDELTVSYNLLALGIAVEDCTFVGTKQ